MPTHRAGHGADPERARFGLLAALVGVAVVLFAFAYPLALDAALGRFGVRAVALGLAATVLATLPLRRRGVGGDAGGVVAAGGLAALLLAAAAADDPRLLRTLPAAVYAGLALAFGASLRAGPSLIERAARAMVPEAPDFIAGYCRAVTGLWAVLFAGCALWIALLAFTAPPAQWRAATGRDLWGMMAGVTAVEFFVRKTWFRYYARGGPFERFWSALFPAERTARGRRSLAAIAEWREAQRLGASPDQPAQPARPR